MYTFDVIYGGHLCSRRSEHTLAATIVHVNEIVYCYTKTLYIWPVVVNGRHTENRLHVSDVEEKTSVVIRSASLMMFTCNALKK